MALNTALTLFLLSLAALCVELETGWASVIAWPRSGDNAARRQLSFIGLPITTVCWLLRDGDPDAWPGYCDSLAGNRTIVPLTILVLRDGRALNALERERHDTLELQQNLSLEMRERLAAQAEALDGNIVEISCQSAAHRNYGASRPLSRQEALSSWASASTDINQLQNINYQEGIPRWRCLIA